MNFMFYYYIKVRTAKFIIGMNNDLDLDKQQVLIECENGNYDEVDKYLRLKYPHSEGNETSNSLIPMLSYAILNREMQIVRILLNKNIDVNFVYDGCNSALMYGCQTWDVDIVSLLLKKGANVNYQNFNGATPLFISICTSEYSITEELLHHGANINHQDKNGITALMLTSMFAEFRIAKLLIRRGVNPYLKDNNGDTFLDYIKDKNSNEMMKQYIEDYYVPNIKPAKR